MGTSPLPEETLCANQKQIPRTLFPFYGRTTFRRNNMLCLRCKAKTGRKTSTKLETPRLLQSKEQQQLGKGQRPSARGRSQRVSTLGTPKSEREREEIPLNCWILCVVKVCRERRKKRSNLSPNTGRIIDVDKSGTFLQVLNTQK